MQVLTLLDKAKSAGISVEACGEELVVKGPKRALTIMQELGRHKAAVLVVLSGKAVQPATEPQDGKATSVSSSKPKKSEPTRPCATVPSAKVSCPPSETAPATITYNGETFEVAVTHGMWFFRRSPEAGWTACSEGFATMIEEQLRQP